LVNFVRPDRSFWSAQRVLLTGHTGFKGAWLALWLEHLGAKVTGFALPSETEPSLFEALQPFECMQSRIGDIRDAGAVDAAIMACRPTIAFHLAAQPLVRRSYRDPVDTVSTNVTGTAVVLDALRNAADLKAAVVITTDKVYRNNDTGRAFIEGDPLGGHDPYSASKAASELVTASFASCLLAHTRVATARAGNVIGGGDWSEDRIIPDVWRAARNGVPVLLRYPNATRPWQHVLDPLCGYLLYAELLAAGRDLPLALNFGPVPGKDLTVAEVTEEFLSELGSSVGWRAVEERQPPEMRLLSLDPGLAISTIGWKPRLVGRKALKWTASWYRRFEAGEAARALVLEQIQEFQGGLDHMRGDTV
jgi:CDP-glucose 4,6-dehydratase